MKHIGNIQKSEGSTHSKKRVGRGAGSGFGGTSTRGHKGQQSRKSYHHFSGFEGGQMPLNRRVPKFGFNNHFRVEYQPVNVGTIQELIDNNKIEGNTVNVEILYNLGIINKKRMPLKILGKGELKNPLTIIADNFSETAKNKIESAGGTVTING
jgi:large subunit ribosomal protein L15